MDPQLRRRRTFDALKKLLVRESLNQPLILIFEDLHWIDSETQGFLDLLSESVASTRILLLTNYRPEYRHEWGTKTYYTQVRLAPLGQEEAGEFLDALLGTTVGGPAGRPPHPQTTHLGENRGDAVLHGRGGADPGRRRSLKLASMVAIGSRNTPQPCTSRPRSKACWRRALIG